MNASIHYFKPSETVVSKHNIRPASKLRGIKELAMDIEHNGQLQPVIIRMEGDKPAVLAGQRRRKSLIKLEQANDDVQIAAIVVEVSDNEAAAISLSENHGQSPMSAMDYCKAFAKLAKQGWDANSIAQVYSMTALQVRQTLALGSLPASVIKAYEKEDMSDACLRLLAIAPKARLKQWQELYKAGEAPTYQRELRQFLAGYRDVISTKIALFDVAQAKVATVEDFFEDDTFFADSEQFWTLQWQEIERIKADFETKKWAVETVDDRYWSHEYVEVNKKDGGKVMIFVSGSGAVEVKKGLLCRTEYYARQHKEASGEGAVSQAKEKPEVTKKLNEYLLGYLTQSAQSSMMVDYDLTQRVLLVMLLSNDGLFNVGHCNQWERVNEQIAKGELFDSSEHERSAKFVDAGFALLKTTPQEAHYERDFAQLFETAMALSIDEVRTSLQAVLMSAISLDSRATRAINQSAEPDMTPFWNAHSDGAFFETITSKPLLLSVLESLTDKPTAACHAKSKVKEIRALIQLKAQEKEGWLPAYFSGGCYGNGLNAPLS